MKGVLANQSAWLGFWRESAQAEERDATEMIQGVTGRPSFSGGQIYRQGSKDWRNGWSSGAAKEVRLHLDARLLTTRSGHFSIAIHQCSPPKLAKSRLWITP